MNRRQILKSALFAPLLGLFKSRKLTGLTMDKLLKCRDELEKNSLKPDENGMIDISQTTGTSGEEVFLGKAVWNREEPLLAPLTVPKGERWTVTNIELEKVGDDMVYYYGYIIYD